MLCVSAGAGEVPLLDQLRSNYKRELAQAEQPVHRRYQEALNRLKLQYTRAGQLEAAVAVDNELKRMDGVIRENGTDSTLQQRLLGTRWQWWEGQSIEFRADGKGVFREPGHKDEEFRWRVTPENKVAYERVNDGDRKLTLEPEEDHLKITSHVGKTWTGRFLGEAK